MRWIISLTLLAYYSCNSTAGVVRERRLSLNPWAKKDESFFPVPVPIPSFLKPDVPDHCKDPLKKLVSFMVETAYSRFLPFVKPTFTPDIIQRYKVRKAGDFAEDIIEIGLTEGNMARVLSRVVAYDLQLFPYFGGRLASKAEPQVELATRNALDSLCYTLNCCFD